MLRRHAHLEQGQLSFTVESRVLRELGERLVKEPEVAFVELIKNAHDADAAKCALYLETNRIIVSDDGIGMTLDEFKNGWMRIGTSSKANQRVTRRFKRVVTGEKGIGRFAVRFLGRALQLRTVAIDPRRAVRTMLTAQFNWPEFDRYEDLGQIKVPFILDEATDDEPCGTTLTITKLRAPAREVDLDDVRSASLSVVSPFQALLVTSHTEAERVSRRSKRALDPGFSLVIEPAPESGDDANVASALLDKAVLRAVASIRGSRLTLKVYARGSDEHLLSINDNFSNSVGNAYADIRFFPDRKGTFAGLLINGPTARKWVRKYHGVAVFDRNFRVLPYGTEGDDWLGIAADVAIRERDPKSSLAKKHFPMTKLEHRSTQTNYMLRLPHPRQLVGIVRVEGRRSSDERDGDKGLIPAADREGFVHNEAFKQLWNVVRGAVEAIAHVDRDLQIKEERAEEVAKIRALRTESQAAIREVQKNPHIRASDKKQIVERLVQTQQLAEEYEDRARETREKLEIMSLLGVVAGFMTHEFGVALDELQKGRDKIAELSRRDPVLKASWEAIDMHIAALKEFVTYTQGYIQGAIAAPARVYPARPRIQQVVRVFGKYAAQRGINVDVRVPEDVIAPLVPVSLYNGIALNLYTNALKAVMAKSGAGERRIIFTAKNDDAFHTLTASDTGIGIPAALRSRVFDPLFTTTTTNRDPLGSGLGLGLTLVKRAVETYGGTAEVITPPEGFATSVRIRLPLARD